MADDLYKPPSFQFYWRDFVADTMHLSAEEVGAYLRLLIHQFAHGSVPGDEAIQAQIAGVPVANIRKARRSIQSFFSLNEEGDWVNERLETVRSNQAARAESGRVGGRQSASKRAANVEQDVSETQANSKQTRKQSVKQNASLQSSVCSIQDIDSLRSSFADLAADVDLYLANAAAENKTGKIAPSRAMGLLRELEALRDEIGVDAFTAGLREANGRGIANKTYVRKCASSAQKAPPPRREEPNSSDKLPTLAELNLPESEREPDAWEILRERALGGAK